jgi:hypothetical protein
LRITDRTDTDKRIPRPLIALWIIVLVGSILVAYGWLLTRTISGDRTGVLGKVAVEIATFPATVEIVFRDLSRHIAGDYDDMWLQTAREDTVLSGFKPVISSTDEKVGGLLFKESAGAENSWRLLLGVFAIDGDSEHAALLLSPSHEVMRIWILDEIHLEGFTPKVKGRKIVHSVAVVDDGSLIVGGFSGSLQRFDRCGRRLWAVGGKYHHRVTLDEAQTSAWTPSSHWGLAQIDVADGEVLDLITIEDIIRANPEIDILELRRVHTNEDGKNARDTDGDWLKDPIHLNDIDPLPPSMAGTFPGFKGGDLLVSVRSLNLVFVLDPTTRKVLWWRMGDYQRQHDPDWLPEGEISIYNNRTSRDFSEILVIDPTTLSKRVVYDGRRSDFYSRVRGSHQSLPSGHIVITSPQQGRAFEVDGDGNTVLDFVNTKPGTDDRNYIISDLIRYPEQAIAAATAPCN